MKKIYLYTTMLLSSVLLFSCLKDENIADQKYGMINLNANKIVGFNEASKSNALPFEDYDAVIQIPVHLSAENVATEDITVTLSMANSATIISDYNTSTGKSVIAMPASLYSLQGSGLTITIPKGSRDGYLTVKTNPSKYDPSKLYGIGLTVASVSNPGYVVAGNFTKTLVTFGAKNKYDGVYTYTTSANTSLVPNANKTVSLITVDANTVALSPGLLGTYTNAVSYTVDPTTKMVTVTCPSLGVQTPQDTRSKWDAATKTMTVYWKQGNGGRTFEEKFVYKGSR
ncbi:MAG: hypothetical protein K0S09_1826 [Sphingobacteriaceae bacterium]|jgi:hypothetical protein|nr:hypothetical protein [Sphingobacteriaceae bacterium]